MYKNMLFGHIFYFFMSTTANFKRLDVKLSKYMYLSYQKILIHKIFYQCTGFEKNTPIYQINWHIFTPLIVTVLRVHVNEKLKKYSKEQTGPPLEFLKYRMNVTKLHSCLFDWFPSSYI